MPLTSDSRFNHIDTTCKIASLSALSSLPVAAATVFLGGKHVAHAGS